MKQPWSHRVAVLLIGSAFAIPAMANFSQQQKITSNPRGAGAQFGYSVAINGNTMVVGARFDSTTASQAGAAFVYVLSGTTWTQQAKLLASDGAASDRFGYSVAISEDTIVVGAPDDDAGFSNAGSAYVFVRNGTTWTQQQRLTANDGTADDEFGNAVAAAGEVIVVGAHFADLPSNSAAGSAYRFVRSGTVWTQTQKLIPVGGVVLGDSFGESLAISGNKLAVGSSTADVPATSAGSVYVYSDSTGAYLLEQKVSISSGNNGDFFGCSVAIEGNTFIGGAREHAPFVGQTAYGAAYVFEFNGATWTQQAKLTAPDGGAFDRFGWSVAISNNVVAVGAREDDTVVGPDAGSVYIYTRSGTTWGYQQKLAPSDTFNGDRFGSSVALSFGTLLVGAAEKALTSPNGQGAAYYFISNPAGAGRVPGDLALESRLNVTKSGSNVTLTWNWSCVTTDTDFGVYEGLLTSFTSHVPVLCSTGGATTATFAPAAGNRYYLVVAQNGSEEGSYGYASTGAERAVSTAACRPQRLASCP